MCKLSDIICYVIISIGNHVNLSAIWEIINKQLSW